MEVTESQSKSLFIRSFFGVLSIVGLLAGYSWCLPGPDRDVEMRTAGMILTLVQVAPTIFWMWSGIPSTVAYYGLIFFVVYTLPKLIAIELQFEFLLTGNQVEAFHQLTLAMFLVTVGFGVPAFLFREENKSQKEAILPALNSRVFVTMTLSQFLWNVLPLPPMWRVCLIGILLVLHPPQIRWSIPFLFGITTLSELGFYISSASVMRLVNTIIVFVAIGVLTKRKMLLGMSGIFMFILVVLHSMKNDYRGGSWDQESMVKRALLLEELSIGQTQIDTEKKTQELMTGLAITDENVALYSDYAVALPTLFRTNDDSFERVLDMTPDEVPFWGGETYVFVLYSVIPRFLWSGKPGKVSWYLFGKRYGYLHEEDDSTSIMFNIYAEAFMNFGYSGLYGFSVLFGLILFGAAKLADSAFSEFGRVGAILSVLPFFAPHADFSSLVSNYIYVIAFLAMARAMVKKSYDEYDTAEVAKA